MSTINGRATIFGFAGSVSFTGIGTLVFDSGDFGHEFKEEILHDSDNAPISVVASGEMYVGKLMFTPVAASGTNTLANAAGSLEPPAALARVTLSSFKLNSFNHARWYYAGGWKTAYKKDGLATYELTIKCAKDSSVDLSAVVS